MVGTSKILTVSYGTFSCTLEGFDEPFGTMKAIAEYFRDLAADDRYFGAEPPTPDAAMLHQIAERELRRRVEARVGDNGVVLRAGEAQALHAPAGPPAPAVQPAPVAPAAAPAEAPGRIEESVAAKLARIRAAVDRSRPAAPPRVAGWDAGDGIEDAEEIADLPAPVAEAAPVAARMPEPAPVPDPAAEATAEVPAVEEVAEEPAPAPAAETPEDEPAAVAETAPVGEAAEAEAPATETEPAAGPAEPAAEIDTILEAVQASEAEPAEAEPVAAEAEQPEDAAQADEAQADEPQAEAGGFDIGSFIDTLAGGDSARDAAPAAEDEAADGAEIGPQTEDEPAEAPSLDALIGSIAAGIPEANGDEDAPAATAAETEEDEPGPEPSLTGLDAEAGDAPEETAEEDEDEPVVAFAPWIETDAAGAEPARADAGELREGAMFLVGDAALRAEDEADAEAEIAEAETVGAEKAEAGEAEADEAAIDWAEDEAEDDGADNAFAADAADEDDGDPGDDTRPLHARVVRVRRVAGAATTPRPSGRGMLTPEQEDDLARELAEVEREFSPRPDAAPRGPVVPNRPAARGRPQRAAPEDAAVARLMRQTDTEMEGQETRRRVATLTHLKAAVAATIAERLMPGRRSAQPDQADPYRDDLAQVVRPARPSAESAAPDRSARVPPLVLVSEQRIDRPAETARTALRLADGALALDTGAEGEAETVEAAVAEPAAAAAPEPAASPEPRSGFAEFAARLDAQETTDRLEAAAAWIVIREEREDFSRPGLLRLARTADGEGEDREDELRGFGTLLREGRILRGEQRGRFTLAPESRLLARARQFEG